MGFLKININLKSTTSNINYYPETRSTDVLKFIDHDSPRISYVGEDTNLQFQQVHKQQQEVAKKNS